MRNFLTLTFLIVSGLAGNVSFASTQDFHLGQQVVLQAKKPIGVPLHREPSPSYVKHVPSGTTATIQQITQDGHWLLIQLASGDTSWVHKKYILIRTATAPTPIIPSQTFLNSQNIQLHPAKGTDQPVEIGWLGRFLRLIWGCSHRKPSQIPCGDT